jgi:hypothetical protein
MPRSYFVYAMRPINQMGPIKIGVSHDPAARKQALEQGGPWVLAIIALIRHRTVHDARKQEADILRSFAADKLRGEWLSAKAINHGLLKMLHVLEGVPEWADDVDRANLLLLRQKNGTGPAGRWKRASNEQKRLKKYN